MVQAVGDDAVLHRILVDEAIERIIALMDISGELAVLADPELAGPMGPIQKCLQSMASTAMTGHGGDYGRAVQHMRQAVGNDVVLRRTLAEYATDCMVAAVDAFEAGEDKVKLPGQGRRFRKCAAVSFGELKWFYG